MRSCIHCDCAESVSDGRQIVSDSNGHGTGNGVGGGAITRSEQPRVAVTPVTGTDNVNGDVHDSWNSLLYLVQSLLVMAMNAEE